MDNTEIIKLRKKIMEKEFQKMNKMQRKAVFCTEGPLLILAGAGSGKTTVLVNRIANLVSYGNAYDSNELYANFNSAEEEMLKLAAENGQLSADLQRKLAVNPCKPWQILAITFTNKAAGELKDRIAARVADGNDIWAATFHSTCARMLRRYGDRIGYTNRFTVYDTDDQRRLMKNILKSMGIEEKSLPHRSVLSEISRAKDKMISPKEFAQQSMTDSRRTAIARAYTEYDKRLKSSDAMDFDDLLCNTVKLFNQCPDVLEYYQNLFKYIMVDEYQDTNQVQYKFVSMLAEKRKNICVVGDDDQSIYKFRGATIENILNFENTYANAKVIRLEQNYRSTQTILDAANDVISHNQARKGKTLWTENPQGDKIILHTALNERDEAKYIADTVLEQVSKGKKFSDFAVLYRMNAQSNAIEQNFSRSGVPHRIIGGQRFYDREEIKDMTSYLQVINNPSDDIRMRRIINKPKRGIGDTTVNHAAEIAANIGESIYYVIKHADEFEPLRKASKKLQDFTLMLDDFIDAANDEDVSIAQLYDLIITKTDYINHLKKEKETSETKTENIHELATNIINYENDNGDEATLSGFLEDISLLSDIDNYDNDADCVVMMTIHSAKGLEFPVVFLPAMEDSIFPGMQSIMNPEELQEERRLAYVAITRAKEKLYLIHENERIIFGSTCRNRLSRFVNEIPTQLLEETIVKRPVSTVNASNSTGIRAPQKSGFAGHTSARTVAPPKTTGGASYSKGEYVMHKAFGKGVILSAQKLGNDTLIEINFEKAGVKKLMANFANLQKL